MVEPWLGHNGSSHTTETLGFRGGLQTTFNEKLCDRNSSGNAFQTATHHGFEKLHYIK